MNNPEMYDIGFREGAEYVLQYLCDEVYGDGIMETDIWKDYFGCPECDKPSEDCECDND